MNRYASILAGTSLQEHFTEALEIKQVMLTLLGDTSGKTVLEPAAGEGAFVSGLIGTPSRVDAVDVSDSSLGVIDSRRKSFVNTINADFIDFFVGNALDRAHRLLPCYDAAIANPPYGLKMPLGFRKQIKKRHPEVYARESYGLFLHFTLSMLRPDGRYVFVVPDTFLQSVYHRPLRAEIMRKGALTHIVQFSSHRFQGVNYGYGKMCIVAGNSRAQREDDIVCWSRIADGDVLDMERVEAGEPTPGQDLLAWVDDGWVPGRRRMRSDTSPRLQTLGDLAECRTGIYTGDNARFLAFDAEKARRKVSGQGVNWRRDVRLSDLTAEEARDGIESGPHFVPLIRGGHRLALEAPWTAIDWSVEAVAFYRTNKKARLQNARYYFRPGLAVPMVTSGRLSASLMRDAVFDQGVVGIFPANQRLVPLLLIYLNSPVVTELKQGINSSANNSANYLKRLPVPTITEHWMEWANDIFQAAVHRGWDQTQAARDDFVRRFSTEGRSADQIGEH